MLEAVAKYFENEYNSTKDLLERNPYWGDPAESVWLATQRCLGVAMFVQTCPNAVSYAEVDVLYEKVRKDLQDLLTNLR